MHEEARALYLSGMSLADIAAKLNKPQGTIRGWKCKERWNAGTPKRSKDAIAIQSVLSNTGLNPKQQLFCLHYSKSFNATKSYQKAYECAYTTALANGPELLGNPIVRDEIMKLKAMRYSQSILKPEDIFQKYMDIAFADIADYLSWGQQEVQAMGAFGPIYEKATDPRTGEEIKLPVMKIVNMVSFHESGNVDGSILSEVKQGKDGASIKLSDRMKALDWLTEHMNMATEEQAAKIAQIRASTKSLAEPSQNRRTVIKYDI